MVMMNSRDSHMESVHLGLALMTYSQDVSSPKKPGLWRILTLVSLVGGIALGILATILTSALTSNGDYRNSQVIDAVTRQKEVALVSLHIEGLAEENVKGKLFGLMDIPSSERASFVKYAFKAKLGIDGSRVEITQTGDNTLLVTIPEFIFIGHSDEDFKLAAENNGALSWMTPEIDHVEMVNRILNDSTKSQYIEANQDVLEDQAQSFYSGIINGVDSNVTVEYRFRGQ
jgi:hypothetical protein